MDDNDEDDGFDAGNDSTEDFIAERFFILSTTILDADASALNIANASLRWALIMA